jgi:hypothetical protein
MAYHATRTVMTLDGLCQFTLKVRRCENPACALYHQPYRPEEETAVALPHGEFGLDVIALIGALRYAEHRSVPEIHRALRGRGISIAERTVTDLLHRYEELVALRLADQPRLQARLTEQGHVVLALDGMQPDVGQEVLWVLRDCLSGEVLLARSLLSATEEDLAALLRDVQATLPVSIVGVISDGQHSIRNAVHTALPDVPHVRGVRPIERALEARDDPEAEAIRGYCLAVRGALTDDGPPPLEVAGLRLHERLQDIHASIARVAEKGGGCPAS